MISLGEWSMHQFNPHKASVFCASGLFVLLVISWINIPSLDVSKIQHVDAGLINKSSTHSKISITNNIQMDSFPDKTGSGTSVDPYVIKNFTIAAGGNGSCIALDTVTEYVVIQNCTLVNSGSNVNEGDSGVYLFNCQNINVTDCYIHDDNTGIRIDHSSSIQIGYNIIQKNQLRGLWITSKNGITAKNNIISNNTESGIYLEATTSNSFTSNNASGNGIQGVYCDEYSNDNTFSLNTFSKNGKYEARDESTGGNKFDNGILGNMYGNYSARYPAAKNDGIIWNIPYNIYGSMRVDHYPLYDIKGTHQPIYITSNSQLDAFCSGNGTNGKSWPTAHIIQGYKISANGGDYCIFLRNISRFVIVENCILVAAFKFSQNSSGVKIMSCSNVRVSNCSVKYNTIGISATLNSKNLTIDNNNITLNSCWGIFMYEAQNSSIYKNTINNNTFAGIEDGWMSHKNNFTSNTIKFNAVGIEAYQANYTLIQSNDFENNSDGVLLLTCNSKIIQNEFINNFYHGIWVYNTVSNNTNISKNVVVNSEIYGIYLNGNNRAILRSNNMTGCGLMVDGTVPQLTSHDVDTSNRVNAKPLYYYFNQTNLVSSSFTNAGEIILINCNSSTIRNLKCSNSSNAIIMLYCNGNAIQNASLSGFTYGGIIIQYSTNCIINESRFNNCLSGISIVSSRHVKLRDNNFTTCGLWIEGSFTDCASHDIDGSNQVNGRILRYFVNRTGLIPVDFLNSGQIMLINCNGSRVSGLNVSHATCGVFLYHSFNNNFTNIDAGWNFQSGAWIYQSGQCTFVNCNFSRCGLYTSNYGDGFYAQNTNGCSIINCTINTNVYGVWFWQNTNCVINESSISFNALPGIYLYSTNAKIHGNSVCNNTNGIMIQFSNFNQISNNNMTGNTNTGINLLSNNNDTIYENWICTNGYGIYLQQTNNNTFYYNTIANNSILNSFYVLAGMSQSNIWYNGTEGNYWGDYTTRPSSKFAINLGRSWNIPYALNGSTSDVDPHPLVWPWAPNVKPIANFTANKTIALLQAGIKFTFTGFEGNTPTNFQWSFGDGLLNATTENPVHKYNTTGQYTVRLTVIDADRDTNVIIKTNYITILNSPSAPQAFTAIGGNAQVVLSWTAPASNGGSNITGYKIYRGTSPSSETLLVTVGNVLNYTDSGLTNGQTYYYEIVAMNGAGNGSKSQEVSTVPINSSNPSITIVMFLIILIVSAIAIFAIVYTRHKKNAKYVHVKNMRYDNHQLFEEPELKLGDPLSKIDQQLVDGSKLLDDRISEKRALLSRVLAPATSDEHSLEEALKPSSDIQESIIKKKITATSEESFKHEVDQQTESEVSVFKKKERCIVCNSVLVGANFICPHCETKYCLRCAVALSDMKENCWTCKNPINFEKGPE